MRVVTDNGANYRAQSFIANITSLASRHQRIRPYTPQQQRHDAVAAPTRRPAAQKSRTLSTWDDFETAFRMWSRPVTL